MIWLRRLVALGALVALVLAIWILVGGGDSLPGAADKHGAEVEHFTIQSKDVGQELPVSVVIPGDAGNDSPLLVFLHGRGGDEDSSLVDPMFEAIDDQGERAPIVAFPYGGESSYWHDRADGEWGSYVVDEVIPQVAKRYGADPDRVAIGGISMGGFGAYDIARLHPERFCAVGGHAPALWASAEETAEGAFDDAEDFAAHDVVAAASTGAFNGEPIWLDSGEEDPFLPGDDAFAAGLESAGADLYESHKPGGHESSYWDNRWDDYLNFYAKALARC